MLSSEGNARERWKTTIGLISKINNFARATNCFLYISLPLFCTTTTRNFQKLLFHGGMSNAFSFTFHFSLPLIFYLHWWPLAFLILSPPLQNFHVVVPTESISFVFLSLALDLCRSFSRWVLLACRLLSTQTQKQFPLPFSSSLSLQLAMFYKTWVAMRFPAKIISCCIWVAIPAGWVILHW